MEQTNDTRVIYFSDLFFSVLHAWRKILIVALVFALLLGGVQTVRYLKARDAQPPAPSEETLQDIAELEAKMDVHALRIASLEDYLNNSIGIQMNPYQIYQASANIYVEAETSEITAAVIWAYQSSLRSFVSFSEFNNIDTKYLSELVTCQIVENAGNILSVSATYSDADGADQLLAALLTAANEATAQIEQDIAPHTVRIFSYPTIMKTSQSLQKQQTDYATSLATLNDEYKTMESDLKALKAPAAVEKPTNPVIFAIVGAVIGAAITACFVWVHLFLSDRVYSVRALKNRTGIKVLGCIPPVKKRNKIDTQLCKWEKRAWHPEQTAIATMAVAHHCQDTKNLLILGNYDPAVLDAFRDALAQKGIAATDGKNILYSTAGVSALSDCDAVLFLETCNKSLFSEMDKAAEIVTDHNKRFLGCILIGG